LLPSTSWEQYSILLEDISVSESKTSLFIERTSTVLLDEHPIHFANAEEVSRRITIDTTFQCLFQEEPYDLAESLTTNHGNCYCDVDGLFYDIHGEQCL
jgi:hypothetical protein